MNSNCDISASEIQTALIDWGSRNRLDYPWRRRLPRWQAIVVEIMLQRTRADQVVPVFQEFKRRFRTADSFARASRGDLEQLMAPLGLKWRVGKLYDLAKQVGESGGRIPTDMDDLVDLPGVGPYVASAVISLHIGNRAVIVDSNVVRVLSRIAGANYNADTRRHKWLLDLADYLTPKYPREYNYALLDLGIQVCLPRIPACERCPLAEMCRTAPEFEAKNLESAMTGNG